MSSAFLVFSPKLFRVERGYLIFLMIYGLVLSVFNTLWTTSVAYNGAAVATVLAYSSAAFSAILGWILFSENLGTVKMIAVSMSILGCILVSGAYAAEEWQVNPIGIVVGLFSGVAFAGYSVMGRAASIKGLNSWQAVLYSFIFAAIFLFVFNLLSGWFSGSIFPPNLFWLGGDSVGWLLLVILAVGPTIGGFGLYTLSLSYLPVSIANIIATLEPPLTAILAYVLLGEWLTTVQIAGSVIILGGVLLLRFRER